MPESATMGRQTGGVDGVGARVAMVVVRNEREDGIQAIAVVEAEAEVAGVIEMEGNGEVVSIAEAAIGIE
jgi:hypothetical protein